MKKPLTWLCFAILYFGVARAQGECGPYVVQMLTRDAPPCHLRFDTDQVDDNTADTIAAGRAAGDAKYQQELLREENIVQLGIVVKHRTPEFQLYLRDNATSENQQYFRNMLYDKHQAMGIAEAVTDLYGINKSLSGDVLLYMNISTGKTCTLPPKCNESDPYRSFNGSCNNLKYPERGSTVQPFARLLLPAYDDGINTPRKAKDGSELPNPRKLSIELLQDRNVPDELNMLLVMQWGQLIAHDVGGSPNEFGAGGLGVSCCTEDRQMLNKSLLSQGCFPVKLAADDPFFSKYDQGCMSVPRKRTAYNTDCQISAGYPTNLVNMIVDCTFVYGWTKERADSLRSFQGGRLRTQVHKGRSFMPQSPKPTTDCDRFSDNDTCFYSGEINVNQNSELSVLQNVLLREHNRIVGVLATINPHWNDEKLYQVGRKILEGIYQHITYKELVPIYVGEDFANEFGLTSLTSGYKEGYDEEILINTFNSFTSGSYRGFHGLVQGTLKMMDYNRCPVKNILMTSWMNQPSIVLQNNNFDQLLLGVVTQPMQSADEFYNSDLTTKVFRTDSSWGLDLGAIDIVRSRDTGLPPYNDFRELCGLKRALQWSDFSDWISNELVDKMSQLYNHPDDVDLYIGGFLETPVPGALQGPTFQCITGEQFYRFKFGDRFFYEFENLGHEFTPEQLQEIRKATVSRLVCDNGDNVKSIQLDGFRKISHMNQVYSCNGPKILSVNLTKWKEEI